MPEATFHNNFILHVRIDETNKYVNPKIIKIEHHDVVNQTVLGKNVTETLFLKTKDTRFVYISDANDKWRHFPMNYEDCAMKYGDESDVKELQQWKEDWETNRKRYLQFYTEKFNKINRQVRWTVLYNRIKQLDPLPDFDDFDIP
jgi:hypothetical protein